MSTRQIRQGGNIWGMCRIISFLAGKKNDNGDKKTSSDFLCLFHDLGKEKKKPQETNCPTKFFSRTFALCVMISSRGLNIKVCSGKEDFCQHFGPFLYFLQHVRINLFGERQVKSFSVLMPLCGVPSCL